MYKTSPVVHNIHKSAVGLWQKLMYLGMSAPRCLEIIVSVLLSPLSHLSLSHSAVFLHHCPHMFFLLPFSLSEPSPLVLRNLFLSHSLRCSLSFRLAFLHPPSLPIVPLHFSAKPNHLTYFSLYPLSLSLHPSVPFLLSSLLVLVHHDSRITAVLSTPIENMHHICVDPCISPLVL